MTVIAKRALISFWQRHPDSEGALQTWYTLVKHASWDSTHEVKEQFGSASIVNAERVVFNISGNRYRLICRINYASHTVSVRFVGTHDEYDQVDAATI